MYCHVHDPDGEYQRQRRERKPKSRGGQTTARLDYLEQRVDELEAALEYLTEQRLKDESVLEAERLPPHLPDPA